MQAYDSITYSGKIVLDHLHVEIDIILSSIIFFLLLLKLGYEKWQSLTPGCWPSTSIEAAVFSCCT
jgi:hypothetical protein